MRIRWAAAILVLTSAIFSLAATPKALAQSTPTQAASAQPDYEAIARGILADLTAKRYDKVTALYSPELAAALPVEKLAASWDGVATQVGAMKSITNVRQ